MNVWETPASESFNEFAVHPLLGEAEIIGDFKHKRSDCKLPIFSYTLPNQLKVILADDLDGYTVSIEAPEPLTLDPELFDDNRNIPFKGFPVEHIHLPYGISDRTYFSQRIYTEGQLDSFLRLISQCQITA